MRENLVKLLSEYKEAERSMELGINFLNERDYALGKLELVKSIIADIEVVLAQA